MTVERQVFSEWWNCERCHARLLEGTGKYSTSIYKEMNVWLNKVLVLS